MYLNYAVINGVVVVAPLRKLVEVLACLGSMVPVELDCDVAQGGLQCHSLCHISIFFCRFWFNSPRAY